MYRRGETYVAGQCKITPYMISAACFIEFKTEHGHISLTRAEFECLWGGIGNVELQFRSLELQQHGILHELLDIPYPSPLHAENVLELE